MKRFKILCVTLIVVFLSAILVNTLSDFIAGARLGVSIAVKSVEQHLVSTDHLCLDVVETTTDYTPNSVNTITGDSVLVLSRNISVVEFHDDSQAQKHPLRHNFQNTLSSVLNLLVIALYAYIIVLFIRIVVSFSRSQIFENHIISRLNRIGILFIILGVVSSAYQVLRIYMARAAVSLPDYVFTYEKCISWEHFVIGLVVLVMTEILRQATTIKQDQDLTI